MELKKGNQTSRPPRAEASLNHVRNAASKRSSGGRSITESVVDDPDHQTEGSRISSTDANSTLTSGSTSKEKFMIQVHPEISSVPIPKSVKGMEYDDSNESLCKLEEYFQSSSSSASQISDVTHESGRPTVLVLPTHRPPIIQVMDRTGGFDPDRIPASIFAKPTTMMDWSLASNESLFSIQIGKSSFSILDLGHSEEFSINEEGSFSLNDLNQSGEMIKSHKLCQPEQAKESGGLEICKEPVSTEKEKNPLLFGLGTGIPEEPVANTHYRSINNDDVKIKIEGFGNGKVIHATQSKQNSPMSWCACTSCGCPSCHRFSLCSCCCCYKWPGCSCKCFSCPKCACGSWPSCYCCRWSDCSCKCLSCPTFTCCSWPDCSKKLCCRGNGLKGTGFSSCCCKWQICSCSSYPSTWEFCKCRRPTWSLKTIFCCLASKSSSAKIPS